MKHTAKAMLLFLVATTTIGFVSCSKDFEPSIFNTDPSQDYVDKSSYTFQLDSFCKREFLDKYNLQFIYKFEDKGSDMNKNLSPAPYDKCVDLAVLSKYLWYDVYEQLAGDGEAFLKENSPRIIHVAGSKNWNPTSGTETLGDASGGIKINLYNANNLDYTDVENLNEYFFHTMHHEFTHILDQTHSRPQKFNTLSNGKYDAAGWTTASDSLKAGVGFVSPYGSSSVTEDWAETVACYVVYDSIRWNQLLQSAQYEWEEVDCKDYNEYLRKVKGANKDTVGYYKASKNGTDNKIVRRVCKRDADDHVVLAGDEKTLLSKATAVTTDKPLKISGVTWSEVKAGSKLKITAEMPGAASSGTFSLIGTDSEVIVPDLKWNVENVTVTMEITLTQEYLKKINAQENPSLSISGDGFTVKEIVLAGEPKVQWLHVSGIYGNEVILQKLDLARQYLNEYYKLDIDQLRNEVQKRTYVTDARGHFVLDEKGKLKNKLMEDNLMETLRQNVYGISNK